jgi:predicted DNA-binding transcriptional regulator AlpA
MHGVTDEEWLAKEVCEYLDIDLKTLWRWVQRDKFPPPSHQKGPYPNSPWVWPASVVIEYKKRMPEIYAWKAGNTNRPLRDAA